MRFHRFVIAAALASAVASPFVTAGAYVEVEPPVPPKCTVTIGAVSRPTLVVTNSQVACLTGTTVNGSISVQTGGALLLQGGTVKGNVTAVNSTYFRMCGATVVGSVTVTSPDGFTFIGDVGGGELECTGNTVGSTISVLVGEGGYMVNGNHTGGNVTVNDNSGQRQSPVPYEIAGNTVGGNLTCLRNNPLPTDDGYPNVVTGSSTNCAFAGVIT